MPLIYSKGSVELKISNLIIEISRLNEIKSFVKFFKIKTIGPQKQTAGIQLENLILSWLIENCLSSEELGPIRNRWNYPGKFVIILTNKKSF